ncbi:MAG: hypothetical protein IPH82_29890 [Chloroflexi bacterium]|nr:hypothetical protein [Chloroflexota bacterium]
MNKKTLIKNSWQPIAVVGDDKNSKRRNSNEKVKVVVSYLGDVVSAFIVDESLYDVFGRRTRSEITHRQHPIPGK